MWEETLGFFVLLVPLALALGYDRMVAGGDHLPRRRHRRAGLDRQPVRDRRRLGRRRHQHRRRHRRCGSRCGSCSSRSRSATCSGTRAGVRKDPAGRSSASRRPTPQEARGLVDDVPALTGRQKLVLVLFFGAFLVMIYGFIPWNDLWHEGFGNDFPLPTFADFYFPEAAVLFLVMAVVIGLIAKLGEEGTVNTIVAGAADFLGAGADHRARPRDHGRDEEHLHDRHDPALDGERRVRHLAGRVRRARASSSTCRSRSSCRRRPATPRS